MSWRAAVEQMLAYEQAGGDGWWRGWEMLKAAYYAAPAPPEQGDMLRRASEVQEVNANATSSSSPPTSS